MRVALADVAGKSDIAKRLTLRISLQSRGLKVATRIEDKHLFVRTLAEKGDA
jgi:hypothetical protein